MRGGGTIELMILAILFVLGLIFGSFVNALVWRVRQRTKNKEQRTKNNQYSILSGRSQCVRCGRVLSPADLVPILSWVILGGRCRYCKQPISVQYPLVEIACAAVFAASYYFWFNPVELVSHSTGAGPIGTGQWLLFVTWLGASVGLLALAVYDLRWMILPNDILYPTFAVALGGRLTYILFFAQAKAHSFWLLALSWLVASGIFWALFMISSGRWIGYGDIRLGLITGTVLASPAKSFLMIFLASLLGTLFVIPLLITRRQSFGSKLPYGPFLILSTAVTLLFGSPIIDWYTQLLT